MIEQKIKRFTLLAFLLFIAGFSLTAQPSNVQVGDVVPPSAEAVAIGKYIEIPPSSHTGVTSVPIHLHSIKANKLSLPISLSYHTGGIRADELSTWVGTGFRLNAGGMVTRTIKGIPDESSGGYIANANSVDLSDINYLTEVFGNTKDSEPDIFSYSLPLSGKAGKFVFDEAGDIRTIPHEDIKISTGGSGPLGFIKIIDTDGTIYHFGTYGNTSAHGSSSILQFAPVFHRTEWHLLRIESYDEKSHIDYSYTDEHYRTRISPYRYFFTYGSGTTQKINEYDVSEVRTQRLSQITAGNNTVTFHADTQRDDVRSVIANLPMRLDSITCQDGTYEMGWNFTYNYFKSTAAATEAEDLRLLLESAQKVSRQTTDKESPYKFSYIQKDNANFLPNRYTKSVDYWGYYNGAINAGSINIPNIDINGETCGLCNADRSSDPGQMKYGALASITSPQGSVITMTYEANRFKPIQNCPVLPLTNATLQYTGQQVESCDNPFGAGTCCGMNDDVLTFSFVAQDDITFGSGKFRVMKDLGDTAGNCDMPVNAEAKVIIRRQSTGVIIYDNFINLNEMIMSAQNDPSYPNVVIEDEIDIPFNTILFDTAVNYTVTLESENVYGRFRFFETVAAPDTPDGQYYTGGLRLKQVQYADPIANMPTISHDYTYGVGTLFEEFPKFAVGINATFYESYPIVFLDEGSQVETVSGAYYFEQSIKPLSNTSGHHIGYASVFKDISNSSGGKEEREYHIEFEPLPIPVQADSYPSSHPAYMLVENGLLKEKRDIDAASLSAVKIQEHNYNTESQYETFNENIWAQTQLTLANGLLRGFEYPYSSRTKPILLNSLIQTLDGVETQSDYKYESVDFPTMRTESRMINSDNAVHITNYSYPDAYITEESSFIGNLMKTKNILMPAWKTEKYIGTVDSSSQVDGTKTVWINFGEYYPALIYRYEATFNTAGSITGLRDWDLQTRYNSYDPIVGLPTSIRTTHWPANTELTWDSDGLLMENKYLDYITTYQYKTGSDLLESITNIDSTSSTYDYDGLMRLASITDDQRSVVSSFDYYFSNGADKSHTTASTTYPSLGDSPRTLVTRTYYDGLSRPIEINKKAQGPTIDDHVIISTTYDEVGRISRSYEPRSVTTSVLPFEGASGDFSLTEYEASPLNRVTTVTSPEIWMMTESSYGMNSSSEVAGYTAGSLFKITQTDANNNKSETFVDRLGLNVLSRKFDGSIAHSTYTKYDDKNRPISIRPPGANMGDTDLIFTKTYAGNDLLTSEYIPGRGLMTYVNSTRGDLIFRQDPLMKDQRDSLYYAYAYDSYGQMMFEGWTDKNIPNNDDVAQGSVVVVCGIHQYGTSGRSKAKIVRSGYDRVINLAVPSSTGGNNQRFNSYLTYNDAGLLSQKEYNHVLSPNQRSLKEYYEYDSADNLINTRSDNTAITSHPIEYNFTTEIDHAGRIKAKWFGQGASAAQNKLCSYEYTAKDQISTLAIGDAVETISYNYLSNQLLSSQTSPSFTSNLYYQDNTVNGQDARLNGDISSWSWTINGASHHYNFKYDGLDRLRQADHNGVPSTAYSSSYSYDKRGNLETLTRRGITPSIIDILDYDYISGNRLNYIEDHAASSMVNEGFNGDVGDQKSYAHDANGNVTVDESRSTTTQYNHMNLPYSIIHDNHTDSIRYEYDFSATLHRISNTAAGTTSHTDYIGAVEYIDGQIKRINHDHGFIEMGPVSGPYVYLQGTQNINIDENWDVIDSDELIMTGNDVNYWGVDCIELKDNFEVQPGAEFLADFKPYGKESHVWFVTDHKQNVRTLLDDEGAVIDHIDYYPFYLRWDYSQEPAYEWNTIGALEQKGIAKHLDVMAYRMCDRTTGRYLNVDPLANTANNSYMTPYHFVANNPVNNVDPLGLDWYKNNDSGEHVWYEGSDARDGFSNVGEYYIMEGNSGFIIHHQNDVAGYIRKSGEGDMETAQTALFGYQTGVNNDIPQFSQRDAGALNQMPGLISEALLTYSPGVKNNVRPRVYSAKPKVLSSGPIDATGGTIIRRTPTRIIVKKGNKHYNITRDRVKEYIPNPRNASAQYGDAVNFKKYGVPDGSHRLSGAKSGKGHKRSPTSGELKMLNGGA